MTLEVADFEVVETERRSGAAVALLVDLSYSMVAEGRWGPMKQTALALAHLVATRFPQDALQIIGFGRYATTLSQAELAAVEPDYQQGTNLSHALALAGRHLRRHSSSDPVVLVVTDGEPTAHLDDDGEAFFMWPPLQETISRTVREVDLLARYGAVVNLFMLGEDPGPAPLRRRRRPPRRRPRPDPVGRRPRPLRRQRLPARPPRTSRLTAPPAVPSTAEVHLARFLTTFSAKPLTTFAG